LWKYGDSGKYPMRDFTDFEIFSPKIRHSPALGRISPVMIFIVVLLPAPFAPSSPKISPRRTENDAPSSATTLRERIPLR